MLNLTAAQLDAMLVAWIFPVVRVLTALTTGPVLGGSSTPRHLRLVFGLVVGIAVAMSLPPVQQPIHPGTWAGIAVFIEQFLIGIGIGLSLRMVMTAVDVAGDIIGFQMGLSFATFFDPNSSGRTAVLAEVFSLLSTLTFLALNGHLLLVNAIAHSFELIPVGPVAISGPIWLTMMRVGTIVFSTGLLISLPVVAALLITNIALAVLTRAAPQLNIFAVGFPVTATVGMVVMIVSLSTLSPVLQDLYDQGFNLLAIFMKGFPAH